MLSLQFDEEGELLRTSTLAALSLQKQLKDCQAKVASLQAGLLSSEVSNPSILTVVALGQVWNIEYSLVLQCLCLSASAVMFVPCAM